MSLSAPSNLDTVTALLEAAEFSPTPKQKAEILSAYPHVREMLARLNQGYGFGDEPAHVFAPLKF